MKLNSIIAGLFLSLLSLNVLGAEFSEQLIGKHVGNGCEVEASKDLFGKLSVDIFYNDGERIAFPKVSVSSIESSIPTTDTRGYYVQKKAWLDTRSHTEWYMGLYFSNDGKLQIARIVREDVVNLCFGFGCALDRVDRTCILNP